jgi:hypothetical protein
MGSSGTWLAALTVLLVAGCGGPKAPPTYAAGGKVVYAGGGVLTGGAVQFQSEADANLSALGEIEKDGTFSLYTIVDGKKMAGAVEGRYRALVIPPSGANQTVQPVALPELYTVKAEGGNHFTLTLPRPHR